MTELTEHLRNIDLQPERSAPELNQEVAQILEAAGYNVDIKVHDRPWGGFNQLTNDDADAFIAEFFPGLSPEEARLGNRDIALSPKILVVKPKSRLSWQYHERRAERWAFLNNGSYVRSMTDKQGAQVDARDGEVVQFANAERHRLIGAAGHYTLVAEIWQHVDLDLLSDEQDIIRLSDDYNR